MGKPDRAGREWLLSELPKGGGGRIVGIDASSTSLLGGYGIHVGTWVTVESDAPLRGPRILQVGTSRMAVARSFCRLITIETAEAGG